MNNRRILFVVEGERTEKRFLDKMYQVLFETRIENIYVYGTAIHDLLERMFSDGQEADLDVVSMLREKEGDGKQRETLEKEFSDVYLIFDMDLHHQKYDRTLLEKAIRFFNDSTENGKLYLNYPMFESIKHFKPEFDRCDARVARIDLDSR